MILYIVLYKCVQRKYINVFFSQWGTMHVFFWMVGGRFGARFKSQLHIFSPLGPISCNIEAFKTDFGNLKGPIHAFLISCSWNNNCVAL